MFAEEREEVEAYPSLLTERLNDENEGGLTNLLDRLIGTLSDIILEKG